MGIGDRITQWVEERRLAWGDILGQWLLHRIAGAFIAFIEILEPEGLDFVDESLEYIENAPGMPDFLKRLIAKIRGGGKPIPLLLLIPLAVLLIWPMITGILQPLQRIINYGQERLFHSGRLDPSTAIRAYWRGHMSEVRMRSTLIDHGYDSEDIETLINVTKFYPGPQDLVTWQAREVFEPDMIAKYGLDDELAGIQRDAFYKAGMTDEQITNYWRAHWLHASWQQMIEMLHRGLVTEEDVFEWFRVVEIVPHWRDLLIQTAYTWPTRVDVRRWWDMRTISEERLRELYAGMGYRGKNLDDYVLWTKVYVAFPDLITRWSNGWISIDDVRSEIVALGMPAERVEEFLQQKIKSTEASRVTNERDLTKSDIYKGVKAGRITRDQGIELLVDINFSYDEAEFLMDVNVPRQELPEVVKDREITKTDVINGLKAEVLTRDEALAKLLELRYTAADAELLLKIYEASIKPPAEEKLREASKADIVAAVKKSLITPEEGYLMLQDINFTPEASAFILTVQTESSPFSPVSFDEFKDRTAKYRRATGMTSQEFNDRLRAAGDELVKATDQVKILEDQVRTEEAALIDVKEIPADAKKRLKDLQVKLNRARAERDRLQGVYDGLIAEFRQGG